MTFPPHFDGKRFYNPHAQQARGLGDVLRWKFSSRPAKSPKFVDDVQCCIPPRCVDGTEIRITMVNHSTVLLQLCGLNILTDPIWSERASPLQWAGPKRRRKPGVDWRELPPIDVVLLSHNHYDHCDLPTLRKLVGNPGPLFVVAKGLAKLMATERLLPTVELDWGEAASSGPLTFHAVPALHFSARSAFDRNQTLWCGFVIESPAGTIYFGADTGYGEHFAQIRERFGVPRVALLPIGAYEPRWFMSPIHMSPDQAIEAAGVIGAATNIAIHHGTFQLADEGLDDPAKELRSLPGSDAIQILANGDAVHFPALTSQISEHAS